MTASNDIQVGSYLFERLKQVNIKTIFGLPGDYNLSLLDYIYKVEGMRWAGNANELNAGYAADGYSRINRISALITTFGVGELSALNAVAGCYSEHVGMLHIVGCPSTESQKDRLLLHHTLGNGDFNAFKHMSEYISADSYVLDNLRTIPELIDNAIHKAYILQKPVYVMLPANMVDETLVGGGSRLTEVPLDLELPADDIATEQEVFSEVIRLIKSAKNPIILVDACASRHDIKQEVAKFMELTQFATFVTPMGKSTVNEGSPRFGGVYVGSLTIPAVKKVVEATDLVISIGGLMSDFNTGSFTYGYNTSNVIEFHSDYTKIRKAMYSGVQMKRLFEKITGDAKWISQLKEAVSSYRPESHPVPKYQLTESEVALPKDSLLSQNWLWTHLSGWLREGDIIITETGTSAFGVASAKFPNNTIGISQVLWGSIGFTVGACLGACFGQADSKEKRRVVLFVGDGSLQLTVQEISTMIRWGLTPYIFVLNNSGYTIEKLIHGPNAGYNEIQPWRHQLLLKAFGANDATSESLEVKNVEQAEKLLSDPAFAKDDKIRLIELFLNVMDAPESLLKQAELTAAINAKH